MNSSTQNTGRAFTRTVHRLVLLVLAVLSGVSWRAELEFRGGWEGLAWLHYFHWVVPVGVLAFIAWVLWTTRVRRPVCFALALLAFGVVGYALVELGFSLFFAMGPSGMSTVRGLGGAFWVLECLPLGWALLPAAFLLVCRAFGARVTVIASVASTALFIASWPLAVWVRGHFESLGSANLIHALKSGFVIPWLVLALGLPLVAARISARELQGARLMKP